MEPKQYSPKSLLKARRPERFSDSTIEETSQLDRTRLEFHLDTLTSRNQEADFARFALELCQKTVCPNLLPQTGPTGGGDSKVDSETFPISDDLSLVWHGAWDSTAAKERWAFAFSAKEDWVPKVRSDVQKIVGTNRGYKKAFFVTNQSVSDKKRAEIEDELRQKHGVDVRVLDRTWILDRVFKDRCEELAIKELKITGLVGRNEKKGPQDLKKSDELEEIEKRITLASQESRFDSALVDDVLDAADLARGLEKPRNEVEGRYSRADKLAMKFGTFRQKVESAYQWAWTLMYWYEDFSSFSDQYKLVEERAVGSENIYDLERLTSLWMSLHNAIAAKVLDKASTLFEARTQTLIRELGRLRDHKDRPSASLQAEHFLLEVQLILKLFSQEPVDEILKSFKEVVLRSKGLVGFPLDSLVKGLTEIGPSLEDLPGYDELFETIVTVTSEREGEINAALLLLDRGENQLSQGKPVKAISTLGQTLGRLYKFETSREVIRALYLCGCAYEELGLLWAARGTLLVAASVATSEYGQYGNITPYQAACYRRLKWLELRLGRLPQILTWYELDIIVRDELDKKGYDQEGLFSDKLAFSSHLVRLVIRTPFGELGKLEKLPDVLDGLGLNMVSDALLYALGYKERLDEVSRKMMGEDVDTFANRLRSLRSNVPVSDYPILYDLDKVLLQSRVIGCRVNVECGNGSPLLEVAESILGIIESFLATSAFSKAMCKEPEITVEVIKLETGTELVSVLVEEKNGRPHLKILCKHFDINKLSVDDQHKLRELLFNAAITVLSSFTAFRDFEKDVKTLFKDERVSERAGTFAGSFIAQANILGPTLKNRLSAWLNPEAKSYPLLRTEPWEPPEMNAETDTTEKDPAKQSTPNFSRENYENLTHEKMETVSLIRGQLWSRAKWSGTAFMTFPQNEYPPVLGFVFKDKEAAKEIFTNLIKEIGKVDEKEQLRVLIVKGIDQKNPFSYRVVIGSNIDTSIGEEKLLSIIYRQNRMDATSHENLDLFLSSHQKMDAFYLAPAFADSGREDLQNLKFGDRELFILAHRVLVRDAWEIGLNDQDAIGILDDDNPIIPEGVKDPPVLKLIEWLKSKDHDRSKRRYLP